MSIRPRNPRGYTLVELLIGASLGAALMITVLATYVSLARNFTRALGVNSSENPPLEAQTRLTLRYFAQDASMASGFLSSPAPSASAVTFVIPTATGSKQVAYAYNATSKSLTRTVTENSTTTSRIIHTNLLSCLLRYYDSADQPYNDATGTGYANFAHYVPYAKKVSLELSTQAGKSTNGTLTQIYRAASPRVLLRNTGLLVDQPDA